ncbi:FAD binding domain-containing protein [Aquabacter spiritensis]|uniref:Carbon-monoxide dehydrogenase medium subunit n=1 Tax=Aquabacter spiritensis TaxID=933073 RepID=A0A4V2UYB4_9HYPH|nr:FAD binding domain-containing protein [Aquabacter spiritensis]TCT06718.1 carbon-monoxide dehydrogenase medium subunit [Aquabacter spiritensis]
MKPAAVDYVRPADLAAACSLLAEAGDAAMPVSGGQSLIPMMSLRLTGFETLVDISRIAALKRTETDATHVVIGAATTHAAIEDGAIPDPSHGLMARIAGRIAYRAVRNLGTIGGSVALADPAADWPCCLLALGADILLAGPDGARTLPADGFFLGPYETARAPAEIITGFRIPRLAEGARWGTSKVARKSGAFSDSLAVAILLPDGGGRIALTGTSSHPRLLPAAGAALAARDSAALRATVKAELAALGEDADPYRARCHLATVTRAAEEAWSA